MNQHNDSDGFGNSDDSPARSDRPSPVGNDVPSDPLDLMTAAWWNDYEEGTLRNLAHYLTEFPGDDIAIAREYIALRQMRDEEGAEAEPSEQRLGPYVLEERVGEGGQATVFRAWDTRHRRTVALKILPKPAVWAADTVQRFQREALIAARLDHEDTCTVFEARMDTQRPYIAMQYVEGDSLATHIARARKRHREGDEGTMPSRYEIVEIVRLGARVARALAYAHDQGVIHRDIKPANIMVRPNGRPKLVDFGLAYLDPKDESAARCLTQGRLGTVRYMSVEQVLGNDVELDRRTDVYSLGLTLYEALTLHYPFTGREHADLYESITTDEPPRMTRLNRAIPKDLQTVIEKCLEKNRRRRYASATELGDELARVADGLPVAARPIGAVRRAGRWVWRHPAKAASAILAVVLCIVLFAFGRAQETERQRRIDAVALRVLADEGERIDFRDEARRKKVEQWVADVEDLLVRAREAPAWAKLHVGEIDRLDAILDRMLQRLALARGFTTRSREQSDDWDRAIADIEELPHYGFTMKRQAGLEPFRRNDKGYWEFWLMSTADEVPTEAEIASMAKEQWRSGVDWPAIMVLLPRMKDFEFSDAAVVHDVASFFIGKFEVTQRQWRYLMGANPSHYSPETARWMTADHAKVSSALHPVELLTWSEATRFALRAFARLATEIEWEYACGAGSTKEYWWGHDVRLASRYENLQTSRFAMHRKVGSTRKANAFGLFDMQGNVTEWCATLRVNSAADVPRVPCFERSSPNEDFRVSVRGGAWNSINAEQLRTRRRYAHPAHVRDNGIGLRLACDLVR